MAYYWSILLLTASFNKTSLLSLFSCDLYLTFVRRLPLTMYALSKLNKQNEQTWVNLQKRLNEVQFDYKKLFPNSDVHNFVKNKAVSVGSCEGYFIPSLLTTTAYLLASSQARVQTLTHNQPLNIFTIFVGYPGTGKYIVSSLQNRSFFYYIHSQPFTNFIYNSNFNTTVFINRYRKIVRHSACSPRPVGTVRINFDHNQ